MFLVEVIEEKKYTFLDLKQKFQSDDKNFDLKKFLNSLRNRRILKFNKSKNNQNLSNFLDEEIENFDFEEEPESYVFNYVGILIIKNFVIKSYPKYLINNPDPQKEFTNIIKVIKKYNNSKKYSFSIQEDTSSYFSNLSIMLYLFEDYFRHGLYTNFQDILEVNGNGEIFWDRTINNIYPFIQENRPYYIELFTKNTIHDNQNYFRLLHEVILTKSSKYLQEVDLLNLFGLTSINLNNKELEDFGDMEYIKYRIRRELNVQFNSHKRSLLKAMYLYVQRSKSYLDDKDYFDYYGTFSYKHIWEEICRSVIGKLLDKDGNDLEIYQEINSKNKEHHDLSNRIDKHIWYLSDTEPVEGKPLRPDFITINKSDDETKFIIFDAKYYNLDDNRPGLEDVTKQFLYELVFSEFIETYNLTPTNCFLFPIDDEKIIHKGYIEFPMFTNLNLKNNKLKLQKIQVILLPAKRFNEFYLKGEIDYELLNDLMNILKMKNNRYYKGND